jgi:hypothetical protein
MARGGYVRKMWPRPSLRRCLISLACAAVALAFVGGGTGVAARPACAEAVLHDWARGALGSGYAPECYEAAIDELPEDLRAYTSAADDITRAAISAGRHANATRQLADVPVQDDPSAFPTEVVVLVGLLLLTAAAGLASALVRRGREE